MPNSTDPRSTNPLELANKAITRLNLQIRFSVLCALGLLIVLVTTCITNYFEVDKLNTQIKSLQRQVQTNETKR